MIYYMLRAGLVGEGVVGGGEGGRGFQGPLENDNNFHRKAAAWMASGITYIKCTASINWQKGGRLGLKSESAN